MEMLRKWRKVKVSISTIEVPGNQESAQNFSVAIAHFLTSTGIS